MTFQHMALVSDNAFDERHTLVHRHVATQTCIMKATHGRGVDILKRGSLGKALVPFGQYRIFVGRIVPVSVLLQIPIKLRRVVQQQRFTMRGGDDNAKRVCDELTIGMGIESAGTTVHGRCQHISFQSQDELTHLGISLGPYITEISFKVVRGPGLHAPILIIDEDATVFDRRTFRNNAS